MPADLAGVCNTADIGGEGVCTFEPRREVHVEVESTFTGFADRAEAGRRLAAELARYRGQANTVVVGLPRGGVVTADAIAEHLGLPLDVLVVRKLGTPGHEELAMGAIGAGGVHVLNEDVISAYGIDPLELDAVARREQAELDRRERLFRGNAPPPSFRGKTVIIVDDGLATGATMEAAIAVLRRHDAARIILAVPVAPVDTLERFRFLVDELVYLETPEPFGAVGYWYVDFTQVEDDEVVATMRHAKERLVPA